MSPAPRKKTKPKSTAPKPAARDDAERVPADSPADLRGWLEQNHDREDGVWLVTHRASVPEKHLTTEQVLDELLSFCWMDGRRKKLDDRRTMQYISPKRTPYWSKTYKDRVARLTREGRMHSAGLALVEAAKRSGDWTFFDDVDALIVPADLAAAFAEKPPAQDHYDAFPPSAKRDLLRWIKLAKTEKTRTKRIAEAAEKAARNEAASGTK